MHIQFFEISTQPVSFNSNTALKLRVLNVVCYRWCWNLHCGP